MCTYNFLRFSIWLLLLLVLLLRSAGRSFVSAPFISWRLIASSNKLHVLCSCTWILAAALDDGKIEPYFGVSTRKTETTTSFNCDVIHVIPFPFLSKYFGFGFAFFFFLFFGEIIWLRFFSLSHFRFGAMESVAQWFSCLQLRNWIHSFFGHAANQEITKITVGDGSLLSCNCFRLSKGLLLIGDYCDEWNFSLASFAIRNDDKAKKQKWVFLDTYIFEIVQHLLQNCERQIWSSGDVNRTAK